MRKSLNTKYLVSWVAAILLLGIGVHFLHGFQVKRNAGALKAQAEKAEEAGDLRQAADYLKQYLGFVPGDTDALARRGLLLANERLATSLRARLEAYLVLDQVLRRDADRPDVRRKAADLAMSLHRFTDAQEHLVVLLQAAPDDGALEGLLGECQTRNAKYPEARRYLESAIKHSPKEIENYGRLARLFRQWTDEIVQGKETRRGLHERADKLIDDMVTANEEAFRAYLVRMSYRREFASRDDVDRILKENQKDIDHARELAPDDVAVLLAAAELAQDQGSSEKARAYLKHGCERHPEDWRPYQALARLERRDKQPDAAVASLDEGLKKMPLRPELLWELADLMIEKDNREKAAEVIDRLGKAGVSLAQLDYLRAHLLINQKKWREAARLLEQVYPLLLGLATQGGEEHASNLVQQTAFLLGGCYEQLADADRAYAAYSRVVARDARSVAGRIRMAATLATMGRLTEAIEQYRQLMREPQAPLAGWVEAARLAVLRNLQSEQPDWSDVEPYLQAAERLQPLPIQVKLLRAEVRAAQKQFDEAETLLKGEDDAKPRPVEAWVGLAGLAAKQGKGATALSILGDAERQVGDHIELRLARARYWARREKAEARPPLEKLAQGLDKFPAEDQRRLLEALANAYLRIGEPAESERLWGQIAQRQPDDIISRIALFDLALQSGHEEAMQRSLEDIRRIQGEEGTLWCYGRICYLIWRARHEDKEGLPEARTLLASVAMRRSNWSRVPLCEAQMDDLSGKHDAALANYQRAIQLGERGPLATRRAYELLRERGRIAEADQVFHKIPEQALTSDSFLQRQAAEVALREQDRSRAVGMAQRAVNDDTKDYRECLWQGEVFWRAGEAEKAEKQFYRARALAEDVPDTWVVLIRCLAAAKKKEQAEAELDKAVHKFSKDQAALALAQCYEAVGRTDQARDLYQAALAAKPGELLPLRSMASFSLRTAKSPEDFKKAEEYLRKIIEFAKPKRGEREAALEGQQAAREAKRTLAFLLTLKGDHQQLREALALLTIDGDSGRVRDKETIKDQRTRATLLAMQQSRQPRQEAIRILEPLIERPEAALEDRFLLAQVYEAVGDWPKARKCLVSLLALPNGDNALYLSHYALSMLRHGETGEAEQVLEKLKKLAPNALPTVEIEARVLKARGKGSEAVALLKAQDKGTNTRVVGDLLEKLGEPAAAEAMYRSCVAQAKQPGSLLVLIQYLIRQKRPREALDACESAWQTCPPVAVAEACLFAISEAPADLIQMDRVDRWFLAALQKHPDELDLLTAQAALRNFQARYDDAEAIYRQLLVKQSRNTTAMNNLAWLLALRGKGTEALDLVQRALERTGPNAELLDTRAVTYLSMGQSGAALKDMEEVVAETRSAASYFHLAQIYQLAKKRREATDAWQTALSKGLTVNNLHPLERPAYQRLSDELKAR